MNNIDAIQILSSYGVPQDEEQFREALETVLTLTCNLHNFMRGLWEEHCVGDVTYTSKEIYDEINREVFGIEDKGEE